MHGDKLVILFILNKPSTINSKEVQENPTSKIVEKWVRFMFSFGLIPMPKEFFVL